MNYDHRMPNAGPVVADTLTAICCRSELTASHSQSHLSRDIHAAECFDPTNLKNSFHILVFKEHLLIVFENRKSSFKGNCVQPNRSQLVWTAAQINNSDGVYLFVGLVIASVVSLSLCFYFILFLLVEVRFLTKVFFLGGGEFSFTANRKVYRYFVFVTVSYRWYASAVYSADLIKLLEK